MRKLKFLLAVLFLFSSFSFLSTIQAQDNIQTKRNKFFLTSQGSSMHSPYFGQYNALGFNSAMDWGLEGDYQYVADNSEYRVYGGFFDYVGSRNPNNPSPPGVLTNGYLPMLTSMFNGFSSTVNPQVTKMIFYRSAKIIRPAFGQRNTYEAEATDVGQSPGFFYRAEGKQVGSVYSNDQYGASGLRCLVNQTPPHLDNYMVSSLFENNDQTNVLTKEDYGRAAYSDVKFYGFNGNGEHKHQWYIKPRMRIPVNVPDNTPVVTIEIYSYQGGAPIKSVTLKAENFKPVNTTYDGSYTETYFGLLPGNDLVVTGDQLATGAPTNEYYTPYTNCHVDYRVKWEGQVDVWLDYVRVDDEWAHYLFTDVTRQMELDNDANRWKFHLRLESEVDSISHLPGFDYFYFDEFYFNNIECLAEVNRLVKQRNPNTGIIIMANPSSPGYRRHPAPTAVYDTLKRKGLMSDGFMVDKYVIDIDQKYPSNLQLKPSVPEPMQSMYRKASNPEEYNGDLNYVLDHGYYTNDMKAASELVKSSTTNAFFVCAVQAHSVESNIPCSGVTNSEKRREPTNEEIRLQTYLALCYGAKQIQYFSHFSWNVLRDCFPFTYPTNPTEPISPLNLTLFHDWGLTNDWPNYTPRTSNYYSQDKYDSIGNYNQKLLRIGQIMYDQHNLKFDECRSYLKYDSQGNLLPENNLLNYFIEEIKSYKSSNLASSDGGWVFTPQYEDVQLKRYWQFSSFNSTKSEDNYAKYFLAVNKRCTPNINNDGDVRVLKIKFNLMSPAFDKFANWKLVNCETNEVLGTFDKNGMSGYDYYNTGSYQPGEGKLLKIVPVMVDGGYLVANEILGEPMTFQCNGMVANNGHEVYIPGLSNINFGTTAGIEMTGGNLWVGYDGGNGPIEFKGVGGGSWKGLKINWSSEASYLLNTKIENVNAPYMVTVVNCPQFVMEKCTLNCSSGNNGTGGVQIYNSNVVSMPLYINNSYFNTYSNTSPAIKIMSYAAELNQIHIEKNHITNLLNPGGGIGILLNNTVGELKQNWIYNFGQGLSSSSSSLDLFGNTISSNLNYANVWGSPGSLIGVGNTFFNLSPAYNSYLGGNNNFSVKQGNCIWLDASYFNMTKGGNYLNIVQSDWRHLYGYFPFISDSRENATGNCFRINGRDPNSEGDVKKYVIYADASPVDFDFLSFNCTPFDYDNFYVLDGGISNDTIWTDGSGNGGGQSTISNVEDFSFKAIYDSMNINMRKKQYELVQSKSKMLMEQYPDSGKTSDAVAKLYLATIAKDSSGNKTELLKSYYESYLQSHSGNTQLVQRVFYFIQKCKVRLNQYASAMQGFQTIMTQFPTTYDGLVAKWDYTATHLLDSISGSGGGEQSGVDFDNLSVEQQHIKLVNLVDDPNDKYDKKKFTKEDRKVIVQNIVNSFETEKSKEVQKVKTLEQKVMNNEATKMEKSDYKSKSLLKTVVKTEVVRTMDEHIDIVQKDLEKVFSLKEGNSATNDDIPVIAYDYKLNQNYPNPFNPTTKINYQIKTPGFVSLKVYDLLGRTIAELVNERLEAGAYTIDFNASKYMLASGIYFYQIRAGEFVDTKRMVLVK